MRTTQYTIRSIPQKLDAFLRRQAHLQSKSLNQVVLDYIQQATKLDMESTSDTFEWIIGANTLDDDSLKAIDELQTADKQNARL